MERGQDNILVDADAPDLLLGAKSRALDVGGGLDVLAAVLGSGLGGESVLLVVGDVELDAQVLDGVGEGGQGTVADALNAVLLAVDFDDALEAAAEVAG